MLDKTIGWVIVPNSTALKSIIPASKIESDKPLILFLIGDGTSQDDFSLSIDHDLWQEISTEYQLAVDFYTKKEYDGELEIQEDGIL